MKRTVAGSLLAIAAAAFVVSCSSDGEVPLNPELAPPNRIDVAFLNAPEGTSTVCMEDVAASIPGSPDFLNCTANDLNLFFTIPGQGQDLPLCLPGDALPDLEVEAHFGSGAQDRWDVGLWIRSDGSGVPDALNGDCRHWSLVPVGAEGDLSAPGGTRLAPFYNEDGDTCGDLNQAFETVLTPVLLTGLICQDTDDDGQLDVGACVGYDNNAGNAANCDDPATAVLQTSPNTPAKCSCGPLNVPVNIGGRIIVEKQTVPDGSGQLFDFAGAGPDGAIPAFSGSISDGGTIELVVAAGQYTSVETLPTGWDLTSIACTEDGVEDSSGSVGTATATFNVEAGETVTCVFTNTQRGRLIVEKQTLPDGSAQSFSFDGPDTFDPSLSDGQSSDLEVAPGQYTVSETVPAGWDLTSIVCNDANSSGATNTATYNIEAGEVVTCVFTNTERGSITIEKQTLPDGDAQEFSFAGDVSGTLSDGETATEEVAPGTYESTETVPADWMLTSIVCDDANSSGDTGTGTATFNVEPGEDVKCVFTNTEGGLIIIEKQTLPDGDPQAFSFAGDVAGSLSDGEQASQAVVPGSYTSTETVPAGWDLTSVVCDDGDSTGDAGTATASFEVEPGETVTCVFTNTKRGEIIIEKQTLPNGDPQSFSFAGDVSGSLSDGQQASEEVVPGSYSSTETVPAGWDLTSVVCDDGDSTGDAGTATASFQVDPGETVTCVFTNTKRGHIVIEKQTLPDGDAQTFEFAGDVTGTLGDGDQASEEVVPGSYSSIETVPSGWDLTDIACDDEDSSGNTGTATASFEVDPGETVTCVFTNTKRGTIIVEKQTDPDGSAQSFAFTGDAAGSIADGGQIQVDDLVPGPYTSTETVPGDWDLMSIACDDGDSSGNTGTATANFDLDPGETVTCVFTNRERATVTVLKTESGTLPLNQAFDFEIRTGADGASSGTVIASGSSDLTTGQVDFTCVAGDPPCRDVLGIAQLVPGDYQLCEVHMMPGWTNNKASPPGFTPDGETPEGGDNSSECWDITLIAGQDYSETIDNTPPPGGDARTIGFWKNWTSCDGNGNQDPVLDETLTEAGGTINLGNFAVSDCETAVLVLDKRDQAGKNTKRANDACYGLAAQLLAVELNIVADAGVCPALTTARTAAHQLLIQAGYDGSGKCLLSKDALYAQANSLAATLDAYNNNELCPAT
jgi:uncharacterized cupredoxin-like copper-binding protein